jgi:hypothetical protein
MAKVQPNRAWGALLANLRERAELTGAQVVRRLATLGVRLDRRTLYTLRGGRVVAPDAAVVWGLAQIYEASVNDLLVTLVASRNAESVPATIDRHQPKGSGGRTDERELLGLLRQLPARARGECEQFIRFQADRAIKSAPRSSRKSAIARKS